MSYQPMAATGSAYLRELAARLWRYARSDPEIEAALDSRWQSIERAPVLRKERADFNLLARPQAPVAEREAVIAALPKLRRHRWFRSLRSSQALAQSVFANLHASGRLSLLAEIPAEDGGFLVDGEVMNLELEHVINWLGEESGRETNIDALLTCTGGYRVAIECKLTEDDVGQCSRPSLRSGVDKNYDRDYCNGSYAAQAQRSERCSLASLGIRYWEHAPRLFAWDASRDYQACPMRTTYQLVRNVIGVCKMDDSPNLVDARKGHAVLLYDARNPSFSTGGPGRHAFDEANAALRDRTRLRRCTWQTIASRLRADDQLAWLGSALLAKYGL